MARRWILEYKITLRLKIMSVHERELINVSKFVNTCRHKHNKAKVINAYKFMMLLRLSKLNSTLFKTSLHFECTAIGGRVDVLVGGWQC